MTALRPLAAIVLAATLAACNPVPDTNTGLSWVAMCHWGQVMEWKPRPDGRCYLADAK